MIKTTVSSLDEKALIELGYRFHQESQFRNTPYNVEGVLRIIQAPQMYPDKLFIAFDDEYRGVIILQMSTEFFSGRKWAGDQVFYVDPAYRKTGLSKDLLDVGKKWAHDNGAQDLVIVHNAGIDLDKADEYYLKQGFEVSGKLYTISLTDK